MDTGQPRPALRNEVARLLESENAPLVSVIVRTIGRDSLTQALDSIARQTYPNIEVIVVDALAQDRPHLGATCGGFPVRVCERGERLGRSRAANVGLEEARGDYVIFLDDDDWFLPSHVAGLVATLSPSADAEVAYAGVRCVGESGRTDRILDLPFDLARLRLGNYIPIHAALIRRSAFARGARFDEALESFEDWDLWLQLASRGPFVHVEQASACYRTGGSSGVGLSPDDERRRSGEATVLEKWRAVWSGGDLEASVERAREVDLGYVAGLDAAAKEIGTLEQRARVLERELNRIKLSMSMQVTAPLRWVAAKLRGLRHPGRNGEAAADGALASSARPTVAVPPLTAVTEAPLISVVVPVYNACRTDPLFLRKALESVWSQTYRHLEVVIVDDGSQDETGALCARLMDSQRTVPVYYYTKGNGGQSSARNFGVEQARGEYVSFLDQDDVFYPDKLERVVALLEPGVTLVYTDADTIDAEDKVIFREIHQAYRFGWPHPKRVLEDILFKDVFVMPGVMTIDRDALRREGGFDESLSGYEDDDLFLRLFAAGQVRYLPEATLKWRQHDENYGQTSRMVGSRLRYWEKLMAEHTAGGTDKARVHGISRRFFREFLRQAAHQRKHGNPMFRDNLATGKRIVPHLAPFERLVFGHGMGAWCGAAARFRIVRHLLENWWSATDPQQR